MKTLLLQLSMIDMIASREEVSSQLEMKPCTMQDMPSEDISTNSQVSDTLKPILRWKLIPIPRPQ